MHKRCPFYGFRWPERQTRLYQVGGNECGLDIHENGPCQMEVTGREVNFHICELAAGLRVYLDWAEKRIGFYPGGLALDEWTNQVMRCTAELARRK